MVAKCRKVSGTGASFAGMSLLEMLLALALSTLVLMLVGNAIHFHLITFQTRRDGVEQALSARAILQHIARDLRAAVSGAAVDLEGIETLSLDPTQLAGAAAGGTLPPEAAGVLSAANQNTETEGSTEADAEATTGFTIGFYGDLTSLQFDLTRLPRLDEYDPQFALDGSGDVTRIPADVRRVTYALEGELTVSLLALPADQRSASAQVPASATNQPRKLQRSEQEVSLAAAEFTSSSLAEDRTRVDETLLESVSRLQFLYFDGYEWWPEWNSDERGGLPLAVEIIVGLPQQPTSSTDSAAPPASFNTLAPAAETLYRLVVKLPAAEPLPWEQAPEAEDATSDTADPAATSGQQGSTP